MLNGFGWPHLLIIAVLIILLFGAKRLPDAARGLGKSMRIFRAETRGMREEEDTGQSGGSGFPGQNGYTPQQLNSPQPAPQQPNQQSFQQPTPAPAEQPPAGHEQHH